MQLSELLKVMNEYVTVWVSDDPSVTEGLFFGGVKDLSNMEELLDRTVKEFYPEHYPAIGRLVGITIIVERVR